jgi:hypothetical protein
MQHIQNTNRILKEDIKKQFEAVEELNISLEDRIKIISSDISYRYKIVYSTVKSIVTATFIEYNSTVKGA